MHDTPQSSFPDLAIADGLLKSSDALNAKCRSGFVLANGAKSAHSCSMKIIEDVRKYAADQSQSVNEVLKKGMEAKSLEFLDKGMKVFAKA